MQIRPILQAWHIESEYYITKAWESKAAGLSNFYSSLDNELWELRAHVSQLWYELWTGMEVDDVTEAELFPFYVIEGMPEEIIEAQKSGIMYYLKNRDAVMQAALPVHRLWWALMKILQRARLRRPVEGADEIDFEEELHGNSKHLQHKQIIVSRCQELDASGDYSSRQAVARAYSEEYHNQFGEDISPRTILRYWREADRRV